MIKKVVMVCVAFMLVTVLAGVVGSIQIYPTSTQSTVITQKNLQFQSDTGPFVGSKNSNVYHYPSCYHVQAIKPQNLITFDTLADACAAGYRPCKDCNPPPCGTALMATPTAALAA
jgi:methylphosphotriester-DNA--protein-cysteine methyltransferase